MTSWSAIDGDGRLKPLYHELRRLYADRLLTVQRRDGGFVVAAVNQSAGPWAGELALRRVSVDGTVVAEAAVPFAAGPRAVATEAVPDALVPAAGSAKELLVAEAGGLRALHFPLPDKEFAYPKPQFEVDVAPAAESGCFDVTVMAHTFVRDLLLQADRLEPAATADRGLVTLLPGESVTIGVRGWSAPDADAARAALYCVEPG